MSFISIHFLIFFAIVVVLYFRLRFRFRWVLLLIASYVFYGYWNSSYIILIVFSTMVDFLAARWLYQTDPMHVKRRRALLAASLSVNLGLLFTFKYFNFFNGSLAAVLPNYHALPLDVLLPVGISFYTFQSMSYTIDVYRGHVKPETNPGIFATYVAFFPQLVAGPIERADNMLPQFHKYFKFDYDRTVSGLRIVLWGIFKKVVIADRVAVYVNAVYNDVYTYKGIPLIVATIFFAYQIYCDFSAYSDIAIGTARILGFDLMENFRQPYLSQSIREFWRRWHISLSTWFRDYLYIPLGGSRVPLMRNLVNLMIVFTVSGLWHGAKWTFVLWGALHGAFMVLELLAIRFAQKRPALFRVNIPPILQIIFTFILVCFGWIFFRSNSLTDAFYIVTHVFNFSDSTQSAVAPLLNNSLAYASTEFALTWVLIALLTMVDWIDARWGLMSILGQPRALFRWGLYYAITLVIIYSMMTAGGPAQTFIYFQF